jgi:hypothetical protein
MKHVTRGSDLLLSFDEKPDPATLHDRHLLMRMIVLGRDKKRFETKATNHHSISDKHLSLYPIGNMLNRNRCPVQVLRQSDAMTVSVRLIV